MTRRSPPGRDTTVLLLVLFAGIAVMALAPPTASTAPSAARVGRQSAATTPTPARNTRRSTTPTPTSAAQTATRTPTPKQSSSGSNSGRSSRIRLMDTKYAKYAYLISNESLTPDAKRALDGFVRNRTRVNATTVRITLTPTQPRYNSYSVLVRNGQKLYFIETSFGDDAPKRETELNDDAPVKVDTDGYVIQ